MKKIRIIHTNDIHSSYDNFLKIAAEIKSLKNGHEIILDAGDFNDFSSSITLGTKGYIGLKLLNQLNYTALTIGNNEGFQNLNIIEKNCNYGLVNILSCNLFCKDGQKIKGLKPSVLKTIDEETFLIIGVSPYLPSYNAYYQNYGIVAFEPFTYIKEEIQKNKGKFNFVILLSHLGLKTDILMSQSIPEINIIISGHSHHVMNCVKVNETYIHQSGVRGSHVGVMDIFIQQHKIIQVTDQNIAMDESKSVDKELFALFNQYKKMAIYNLSKPILNIPVNLEYSIDQECNFANLLADYMKNHFECDFALVNSGLTEANLKAGEISMKDILKVCNSPLYVSTMAVQGKIIIQALNMSTKQEKCHDHYRRPGFRGTFLGKLHVSYNCKIKQLFPNNIQFFINNQLIETEKYYKIVTSDYFLRGMGYEVLGKNKDGHILAQTIKEIIIEALQDESSYIYINQKRWEKEI